MRPPIMHRAGHVVVTAALAALISSALSCRSPSDVVYERPPFSPLPDAFTGRVRVTFAPGADQVRGFTPDGRLLFRAHGLVPFGPGWILASVPPLGGQVREEASVYRPVFRSENVGMGALAMEGTHRALVLWVEPIRGFHGCPDSTMTTQGEPPPPAPSPIGITIYTLPAQDGPAIGSLSSRYISLNAVATPEYRQYAVYQHVRVTPAGRDVDRTGVNAYGPVILPGTDQMVYSDGERLWRASMVDTSAAPDLLGDGAYPALSPDGQTLAYARPLGVDSTMHEFSTAVGLTPCIEDFVDITAAAWEVVLRDLDSGTEEVVGEGMEPAFDPLAARLVVRGTELRWLNLDTQESSAIPGTRGVFGPAISPDGTVLAFSMFSDSTNTDVYVIWIDRG